MCHPELVRIHDHDVMKRILLKETAHALDGTFRGHVGNRNTE
jgi:hypothetical protein